MFISVEVAVSLGASESIQGAKSKKRKQLNCNSIKHQIPQLNFIGNLDDTLNDVKYQIHREGKSFLLKKVATGSLMVFSCSEHRDLKKMQITCLKSFI